MRQFARVTLALSTLLVSGGATLLAMGCGDSTSPNSIAGAYTLRTIDGNQLPFTFDSDEDGTYEIVSDVLTLEANATFSEESVVRTTDPDGSVTTDRTTTTGRWTVSGPRLTLLNDDGDTTSGTVSGGTTITFVSGGYTGVYTK